MEKNLEEIGRRIRQIRKTKGLSQARLGELVGLSPQAISQYENGGTDAGAITLAKISAIGEVTLDWLISNIGQGLVGSRKDTDWPNSPAAIKEDESQITEIMATYKNTPVPLTRNEFTLAMQCRRLSEQQQIELIAELASMVEARAFNNTE